MKLLSVIFASTALIAGGGESYFFTRAPKAKATEKRIEGEQFHIMIPITKIDPPRASSIYASHSGLGPGREYQIEIELMETPAEDWLPMLKLDDDVIDGGIAVWHSGQEGGQSALQLESDDPEKIRRWCQSLGTLLKIPDDQIEIDLTKATKKDADPAATAPEAKSDDPRNPEGKGPWKLGSSGTLSLKMAGDSTVFLLNGDQEVFRLKAPESMGEAQPSDDGKSLALVVMKRRGGGSDFAALVRVHSIAGKLRFDRVLDSRMKLFEGRHWWLSNLGAMSNDGARILANFGVEYPVDGGSRMAYNWYTLGLPSGAILSKGLAIANSRPPARKKKR